MARQHHLRRPGAARQQQRRGELLLRVRGTRQRHVDRVRHAERAAVGRPARLLVEPAAVLVALQRLHRLRARERGRTPQLQRVILRHRRDELRGTCEMWLPRRTGPSPPNSPTPRDPPACARASPPLGSTPERDSPRSPSRGNGCRDSSSGPSHLPIRETPRGYRSGVP